MRLFVYCQSQPFPDRLHKWYTARQINIIRRAHYWFVLLNDKDEIVADCGAYRQGNIFPCCLRLGGHHYAITDVMVYPTFRGNQYCVLLLLNVLSYFSQLEPNQPENGLIRWYTHRHNLSAVRAYRKICTPVYGPNQIVYFST